MSGVFARRSLGGGGFIVAVMFGMILVRAMPACRSLGGGGIHFHIHIHLHIVLLIMLDVMFVIHIFYFSEILPFIFSAEFEDVLTSLARHLKL